MKRILNFAFLATLAISALCSCSEKDSPEEVVYLPVTANNISGSWKLAEQYGEPLADGLEVYLELTRRDTEFTLYDNIGSFKFDVKTGIYSIDTDNNVISGRYDHYVGYWAHSYVISGLTADRMVWTATDDPDEVSVYVRIDNIPAEVTGDAGSDEE